MRTGASLFLRADGRWEARYQKARDENGKIIYGFAYGATQEEAEQKRSEALRKLYREDNVSASLLPSLNPNISSMSDLTTAKKIKMREKAEPPFSDDEIVLIDECLFETHEKAAVGFYLCLHMGLSLSEIMALRYEDIDLESGVITIQRGLRISRNIAQIFVVDEREVFIPKSVRSFLEANNIISKNPNHFVLTDSENSVSSNRMIGASFARILKDKVSTRGITINALRCTFIKKCLESNMNIESVSAITGMEKTLIYRYYGKYIKADPTAILRLDEKTVVAPPKGNKKLNLLILGAGSHGHNVLETAEKLGVFREIKFLDDNIKGADILDVCTESYRYLKKFPCAFVAIGDNDKRKFYAEKLRGEGFMLPHIIHPDATISKNATVGDGTIVMAQATVNASTVGELCIVASNALINFGATVDDFAHIDCGGIVMKDAKVPKMTFVASGEIYK